MRHLMSPLDLSVEELYDLLSLANDIEQNPKNYAHACEGKNLPPAFMNQVRGPGSALKRPC